MRSILQFTGVAAAMLATVLGSLASEASAEEIDTDHLFSFNVGTDIDEPGAKEIESSFDARFGRGSGRYVASENELSFQFTPVRNLSIEVAAGVSDHQIANVPALEDRNRTDFSGLSFAAKFRLAERSANGIGLALSVQPTWSRVDDESGEPTDGYGAEFVLAADKELAQGLVGVVNVRYSPETARSRQNGCWSRAATVSASGGLMHRLAGSVFAGLEARYLRRYDALDLGAFSGQALYLGPNLIWDISERWWIAGGWSTQVFGRSADGGGTLDLDHFARNEARFAMGLRF